MRVARAANPKGTTAMWVRDRIEGLWEDEDFAGWYSCDGRPAWSPAQLATVCVLQFLDNLSDRQAAEAVRCRIDYKYALGLELEDPGFHHSVLSDFHDRLAEDDRADRLLDLMLARLTEAGLVKARGRQRTDSTRVLSAGRELTRLELVTEAVRAVLEHLATAAPQILDELVTAEWSERYGRQVRMCSQPSHRSGPAHPGRHRRRRAARAGLRPVRRADPAAGRRAAPTADPALPDRRPRPVPAPHRARRPAAVPDPRPIAVRDSRPAGCAAVTPAGPATFCTSPRPATRTGSTSSPTWPPGYRRPTPRRCPASTPGSRSVGCCRGEHLVDGGYASGAALADADRNHKIALVGPIGKNSSKQAKAADGFAKENFIIDFDRREVTCPNDKVSGNWNEIPSMAPYAVVRFGKRQCGPCPEKAKCTSGEARTINFLPRRIHELQERNRDDQQDSAWRRLYASRSGAEGTIAEFANGHRARHCRYRGQAKTHVQHVLTAIAVNIERLSQQEPAASEYRPRSPTAFQQYLDAHDLPRPLWWRQGKES